VPFALQSSPPMTFEPSQYLLAATAALVVGLSKTGLPGGAIPAVVLMAMVFPEKSTLSVGALLPILIIGDVVAVGYYRRDAQWDKLWRLFPFVAIGMIPACYVLLNVENRHFRMGLGILVVLLLVLELLRRRFQWKDMPHQTWFVAGTGLLTGFGTTVGNAAGPVMSIYALSMRMAKTEFMGTFAWFFFLVNTSKVPLFLWMGMITPRTLWLDLTIVPAALLGAILGRRLLKRLPQRVFDVLVLLLTAVAAARLIATA